MITGEVFPAVPSSMGIRLLVICSTLVMKTWRWSSSRFRGGLPRNDGFSGAVKGMPSPGIHVQIKKLVGGEMAARTWWSFCCDGRPSCRRGPIRASSSTVDSDRRG